MTCPHDLVAAMTLRRQDRNMEQVDVPSSNLRLSLAGTVLDIIRSGFVVLDLAAGASSVLLSRSAPTLPHTYIVSVPEGQPNSDGGLDPYRPNLDAPLPG